MQTHGRVLEISSHTTVKKEDCLILNKCLEKSILFNISDIYQESLGNSIDKIDIILGEIL